MHRKIRFHQGDRVNALSLTGKKVFGVYRGVRASYGAYVYGLEVGSTEPSLHICNTLTLERVKPEAPPKKVRVKAGDPCTGRTQNAESITGFYMNSEG